jgi:hypothetical protein
MSKRKALTVEPNVRIEDIMTAREGKNFEKKVKKFYFYI